MITALTGARVHFGDALFAGQAVVIDGARISAILPEGDLPVGISRRHLGGGILAAGYIDTQVNGGGGVLFNDDPSVPALRTIAAAHRRFGTTGFLATVISDEFTVLERAVSAVAQAMAEGVPGLLGIHIEGPMLATSRRGIHVARFMRNAQEDLLGLVCSLPGGRTLVTLAPEIVGSETINRLVEAGVRVSAGHTEATYEEMTNAFAAGVTGVTHLFNAMSQLTPRAPGAVGAILDNDTAWCGIIADGVHVHPASLRAALRARPIDRFMLVTDAMPCVGTQETHFMLQGREIQVTQDRCIDAAGTLAGSNLTMDRSVVNAVDLLGLSVPQALSLGSANAARFLGDAERGQIAPGKLADLVWLDDSLRVKSTWIAGHEAKGAEA